MCLKKEVLEKSSQVDEQNHKIEKNKRCVHPFLHTPVSCSPVSLKAHQKNVNLLSHLVLLLSAGIWSSNRLAAFRLSRKRYNRHVDLLNYAMLVYWLTIL